MANSRFCITRHYDEFINYIGVNDNNIPQLGDNTQYRHNHK